jgi:hypothetical protein
MAREEIVVAKGTVKTFNRTQARGEVLVGAKTLAFDSTCFHSGRPTRSPRPGESVEVLFAKGDRILGVRVAKDDER